MLRGSWNDAPMRPDRGSIWASFLAFVVAFSAAPAIAKLQLHVLGLQRGGRFGIKQVYNGLGCHGRNLSPALRISGVPAGTKSLAVTMFDPDAPTQSGWWQWLAYDLPAGTRQLAEGAGLAAVVPCPTALGRDGTTSAR